MGCVAMSSFPRPGSGVSSEAQEVGRLTSAVSESTESSYALFGSKSAALSELRAMADECAVDDWDCCGANGVDPFAVLQAETFLRVFPDNLPLPEFAAEPDGSVSLDWIITRHKIFSLSIGASDRLAYAWLDGTDKGNGVARFDGSAVPERILRILETIVPHADTTLRAA